MFAHWCPLCQHQPRIPTCGRWKTHMRGHYSGNDKLYVCMPEGPVESTDSGLRCAFCGAPAPDEVHLTTHNFQLCKDKPIQARLYEHQWHLEQHVSTNHPSLTPYPALLAQAWQRPSNNYFQSSDVLDCGFCILRFSTFEEYIQHVDDHYHRFENIKDWKI